MEFKYIKQFLINKYCGELTKFPNECSLIKMDFEVWIQIYFSN